MIDVRIRNAVAVMAATGTSAREISARLGISRNTVAAIIAQDGEVPGVVRSTKVQLDADLLTRLYADCEGYAQRVHEKLVEEHHIEVPYSTLTRRLRELRISTPPSERCDRVPDQPGA